MKISAIYKIQSMSFPDRIYIGSSVDIKKRWCDHLRDLKFSKHQNPKIQKHYDKYGKDDFVFVIIEPCFPEFLIIREQYYIDTLNPYFNIRRVADSNLGMKLSEETKKRMSEIHLARNYIPTQETRDKISKANKGKTAWNKGVPLGYIPKCAFKKGMIVPTKKILQFDSDMNFIKEWESITKASNELSLWVGNIVRAIKGGTKMCGGFIWKYKIEEQC